MFSHCPGARAFMEPIPEPITCPHCGREIEIFTTEQSMKCYYCGGLVTREKLPSCFEWCKFADICKGEIEASRRKKD